MIKMNNTNEQEYEIKAYSQIFIASQDAQQKKDDCVSMADRSKRYQ